MFMSYRQLISFFISTILAFEQPLITGKNRNVFQRIINQKHCAPSADTYNIKSQVCNISRVLDFKLYKVRFYLTPIIRITEPFFTEYMSHGL